MGRPRARGILMFFLGVYLPYRRPQFVWEHGSPRDPCRGKGMCSRLRAAAVPKTMRGGRKEAAGGRQVGRQLLGSPCVAVFLVAARWCAGSRKVPARFPQGFSQALALATRALTRPERSGRTGSSGLLRTSFGGSCRLLRGLPTRFRQTSQQPAGSGF